MTITEQKEQLLKEIEKEINFLSDHYELPSDGWGGWKEEVIHDLFSIFLKSFKRQNDKTIRIIKEYGHIYTEKEILLMDRFNKMLVIRHNKIINQMIDLIASTIAEMEGEK